MEQELELRQKELELQQRWQEQEALTEALRDNIAYQEVQLEIIKSLIKNICCKVQCNEVLNIMKYLSAYYLIYAEHHLFLHNVTKPVNVRLEFTVFLLPEREKGDILKHL